MRGSRLKVVLYLDWGKIYLHANEAGFRAFLRPHGYLIYKTVCPLRSSSFRFAAMQRSAGDAGSFTGDVSGVARQGRRVSVAVRFVRIGRRRALYVPMTGRSRAGFEKTNSPEIDRFRIPDVFRVVRTGRRDATLQEGVVRLWPYDARFDCSGADGRSLFRGAIRPARKSDPALPSFRAGWASGRGGMFRRGRLAEAFPRDGFPGRGAESVLRRGSVGSFPAVVRSG